MPIHNKDFILRLIEELGEGLAELLREAEQADAAERDELERRIQGIARRAGLDLDLAEGLAAETLGILVAPMGTVDAGRCVLLGELLLLRGAVSESAGEKQRAIDRFTRARLILSMIDPRDARSLDEDVGISGRIAELDRRLTLLTARDTSESA